MDDVSLRFRLVDPDRALREGFEEVLPSMSARPETEVIHVNLSIPDAESTVLGLELVLRQLNGLIVSTVRGGTRLVVNPEHGSA